ncbi:MAG: DUF4476 domain-containing protein [Bacteroidota bacterium]|nr:DUF4476 domain-containing protein [Bacteroidota bacterium]
MKSRQTILLALFIALLFNSSKAQEGGITIFDKEGNNFSLVLNGEMQNTTPKINVHVAGLTAPRYEAKIIYENTSLNALEKNIYLKPGFTVTYQIKRKRNGDKVIRYYSEEIYQEETYAVESVEDSPGEVQADHAIQIQDVDDNSSQGGHVSVGMNVTEDGRESGSVSMSVTESGTNGGETQSMHMSVSGNDSGVSVDVSVSESLTDESHGVRSDVYYNEEHDVEYVEELPNNAEYDQEYGNTDYSGGTGCRYPMTSANFNVAKQTVNNQSFEDDKLMVSKQIINSNCLTVAQVKALVSLFSFDDNKLELAKHAYLHTFDIENYYMINDVFSFSSSIEELDEYISGLR